MKERCETAERLELLTSDALHELPLPNDPDSNLKLNTCTVPLSLEAASHWAVEEKARL